MAKQSFTVDMAFDRKTAGGQHLFQVIPDQKDTAGARNIYCTKNSFPPGVNPKSVRVTVEYDDNDK